MWSCLILVYEASRFFFFLSVWEVPWAFFTQFIISLPCVFVPWEEVEAQIGFTIWGRIKHVLNYTCEESRRISEEEEEEALWKVMAASNIDKWKQNNRKQERWTVQRYIHYTKMPEKSGRKQYGNMMSQLSLYLLHFCVVVWLVEDEAKGWFQPTLSKVIHNLLDSQLVELTRFRFKN